MTTKTDERRAARGVKPPTARSTPKAAKLTVSFAGLALLSACAGSHGSTGVGVADGYSTDYYIQHAAGNYQPPGPPSDPWGPYIRIAARRFDVPEPWVRQVMRVESGGQEYMGGQLTVSSAGAMGLMQLEPETYQEMAARYGLGDDPFNPYNNIMAGTAYIHEMYTVYGSPGFLAAYNAGPGRLDRFLNQNTPLPDATQNYVAMIAPNIQGYYPAHRSEADQLAMNTEPMGVSTGILPPGFSTTPLPSPDSPEAPSAPIQPAAIDPAPPPQENPAPAPDTSLVADTSAPPPAADAQSSSIAAADLTPPPQPSYQPPPEPQHHFALIASAMADTPTPHSFANSYTGAGWAIQVGAYASRENAKAALGIAELSAVSALMHGQPMVERVESGATIRYRARFVNLPHDDAINACHHLSNGPTGCTILSPDAQG